MRVLSSGFDPFALPVHGGDLPAAEARFGRPADGWLDLSTGINPFSYPLPEIPPSCWERLPDASLEGACRLAASRAYGVGELEQLVTAAGSQAVIQLLPRLRPFSRVAVVGPTYNEHASCWANAGHHVVACETLDRVGDAEVVIVCNPNNPDGRRYQPGRLQAVARDLAGRGGWLVVDEAFGDTAPELSLAGRVEAGLIVLKSFGKFFGLAGVRLGFGVAEPALARLIRAGLGPWAASGPAMLIGARALADDAWIGAMRERLAAESAALDAILGRAGLSVTGGTLLFRLINAPRAWALYEHLGQRGILVRPFVTAARWLRCGLPPGDKGRHRLSEALAAWQD